MPAFGGVTYYCDASVSADICGTLNNVIAPEYSLLFSNANASIYVQFGDTGPAIGENTQFYNTVDYSWYYNALNSHKSGSADSSAINSLGSSSTNPVVSGYGVSLTSALDQALGLLGGHGICTSVTMANCNVSMPVCAIGAANCYNDIITITNTPNALYYRGLNGQEYISGQYDFFTTVEHETDEALGTASCLEGGALALMPGCSNGGNGVSAADLFRYSAPGVRSLLGPNGSEANGTLAYFSLDGGVTNLVPYFNRPDGPDYGDFSTTCTHVQDTYGCNAPVTIPLDILTDDGAELAVLDAVGYNLTDVGMTRSLAHAVGPLSTAADPPAIAPEPGTIGMVTMALAGLVFMHRVRKP